MLVIFGVVVVLVVVEVLCWQCSEALIELPCVLVLVLPV